MVGLYGAFSTNVFGATAYTGSDAQRIAPVSILPARLLYVNQRLAVAPRTAAQQPLVDAFLAHVNAQYPALNGSTVGGAGFTAPALRNVYIPPLRSAIVTFPTEADLEAYVRSTDYGQNGAFKVWGAIVLNSGAPGWDYSLRMNNSEIPTTSQVPVNILQRGVNLANVRRYVRSDPNTAGPPFLRNNLDPVSTQVFPGFTTLQLMVDRWIINRTAGVPLDTDRLLTAFTSNLANMLPPPLAGLAPAELAALRSTSPATFAAIASDIGSFLRAESLTPQQVDLVPFPTAAYQTNAFYAVGQSILAFFFVIALLFPVSRMIRGIVMEKEAKLQEGMRMMGMGDAPLLWSWLAVYFVVFLIISAVVTGLTRRNIFKGSDGGLVFLTFMLFGISAEAFAYLVRCSGEGIAHGIAQTACSKYCHRCRSPPPRRSPSSSPGLAPPPPWASSSSSAASSPTLLSHRPLPPPSPARPRHASCRLPPSAWR